MSNSEEQMGKVHLVVAADTPFTEIFIIDGQFRRVGKGLGNLEIDLPPGLYNVKFKSGSLIKQIPAILEQGNAEKVIRAPTMKFSSPAPFNDTLVTHEYHCEPAEELSRQVHANKSSGSQIFIFTRDLETKEPTDTMKGLSLHELSGRLLIDFSGIGKTGSKWVMKEGMNPWGGYTVSVTPGIYRLRVYISESQSLEQTIVACGGWQTQIFLKVADCIPGEPTRYPDLTDASIFMTELNVGYFYHNEEFRLTEIARQGLVNRRDVVPLRDVDRLLRGKFNNPMAGIYGAHLSLLSPEPDIRLLDEVVNNLYRLIGDHPDVRALGIYLARMTGKTISITPYSVPPMLRSSWDIVVDETAIRPDLVPVESLAARVSDRLWGFTPWMVWQKPEELDTHRLIDKTESIGMDELTVKMSKVTANRRMLRTVAQQAGLTPLEENLLSYMSDITDVNTRLESKAEPSNIVGSLPVVKGSPFVENFEQRKIVQKLGVPSSVASAAVESLMSKLERSGF